MSIGDFADDGVINGTKEIKGFVTYAGDGFAAVRSGPERGDHPPPTPATNRSYLRRGLPDMYRDEDFGMRFVAALEGVLDPLVAVIDMLPAHFDPDLAPLDILDLSTRWLGLARNEAQPAPQLRNLVRRAADLGKLRGTLAGMELALALNFPDLPLRVEDRGGVAFSIDGTLPDPEAPSFVVYCDEPIERDLAATVARVIDAVKPAHVSYRLRIRGPRPGGDAAA
jgi:phage tail-like protein